MNKIQPQIELFPSFIGNLPTKPYCTDDLSTGLKIRPRDTALDVVILSIKHQREVGFN